MPGPRGLEASAACSEVVIHRSQIMYLAGAGIFIAGVTQYTIVNTGVFSTAFYGDTNIGEAGVVLNSSASGTFAFNSLRLNGHAGSSISGGLDCGVSLVNRKIVNSLVIDNEVGVNNSQISGNCALIKVNIGEIDLSTLPGAIHTNCLFANSEDAQLDPNDTKCVNQADPDASVSIDFFGNPRPQGGAADIGYQELK